MPVSIDKTTLFTWQKYNKKHTIFSLCGSFFLLRSATGALDFQNKVFDSKKG